MSWIYKLENNLNFAENDTKLKNITIYPNDVEKAIDSIKTDCSPGPDNIHPLFIKKCKQFFIDPLTHIFNLSIKSGIYPSNWKISYITPVYKAGDKTNIISYIK